MLESSFVAEVKSDLMGEQTILCGMLQTGAVLCFDKMVAKGIDDGQCVYSRAVTLQNQLLILFTDD